MERKRVIRAFAIIVALLMTLSIPDDTVNSFTAKAVTQSQIDALKKKGKDIEKRKQEIVSKLNSLEYQQSTALSKKEVLDAQIDLTQEDIDNISEQIETYTKLIAEKKEEVITAQQNEDKQWALYKIRIRVMEEYGSISYISVIFQADSYADLLARMDIVGEIMKADEDLYNKLKASKQATKDAEASLEAAKADQEIVIADLKEKQAELQTQLDEADAFLKEIEDDIDAAKELLKQEDEAARKTQDEINKKAAELKKQQAGQSGSIKGTGTYLWPTPSCLIVTRPYGRQEHPVYHDQRMHYGIDIGAKYGANILAADSGTVIISEYSSSYGNYIVISHGNGQITLYGHMSTRTAKVGSKVSKGEVIGKVGSTGVSTGPHLHFEISVDGVRVNPLNYFSGYTKDY